MNIAARCVHGAGVCVIPSPANNHRPYAIRHKPLAAVAALLILSKVLAFGVLALTPAQASLSTITTARIIQLTNEERKKAGLKELNTSDSLMAAAAEKGAHMLEEDYFAHISPSGVTPWFWIDKSGYQYLLAGENLAIDFFEAEDVVEAWLNSPSHKDNMLHPDYAETGVGVVTGEFQGGTSIIVVHMFGRPAVASATTPSPSLAPVPEAETPIPAIEEKPGVPRIALADGVNDVRKLLPLYLYGDPGSTVTVTVNSQAAGQVKLGEEAPTKLTLDVADFPDGQLLISGFAENSAGKSESGASTIVSKDTVGPVLAAKDFRFVLGPATDKEEVFVMTPQNSEIRIIASDKLEIPEGAEGYVTKLNDDGLVMTGIDLAGNTTSVTLQALRPRFKDSGASFEFEGPRTLNSLSRRLALGIGFSIFALLGLAVFIRFKVQHTDLISHASAIVIVAALFFLW